jgi:MFS family permease
MLTGVGAATWVAFAVYFVAYYPASEAPKAIGIINSVQGVALVISTYAGGLVAQRFGYGGAFFGAAILGLVALAALERVLRRLGVTVPAGAGVAAAADYYCTHGAVPGKS